MDEDLWNTTALSQFCPINRAVTLNRISVLWIHLPGIKSKEWAVKLASKTTVPYSYKRAVGTETIHFVRMDHPSPWLADGDPKGRAWVANSTDGMFPIVLGLRVLGLKTRWPNFNVIWMGSMLVLPSILSLQTVKVCLPSFGNHLASMRDHLPQWGTTQPLHFLNSSHGTSSVLLVETYGYLVPQAANWSLIASIWSRVRSNRFASYWSVLAGPLDLWRQILKLVPNFWEQYYLIPYPPKSLEPQRPEQHVWDPLFLNYSKRWCHVIGNHVSMFRRVDSCNDIPIKPRQEALTKISTDVRCP